MKILNWYQAREYKLYDWKKWLLMDTRDAKERPNDVKLKTSALMLLGIVHMIKLQWEIII